MKDSIKRKLEITSERMEEISALLADSEIISDQNKFRELSLEYAHIEPIIKLFNEHEILSKDLIAAEEMIKDNDLDIQKMGERVFQGDLLPTVAAAEILAKLSQD